MRPSFHPRLVNDPFSDPVLFIPFLFEKRALLFDLGDVRALSPRDMLKVSHVFVTHAHMDHFFGFDALLRILLGRGKTLHFFGPPDFFARVEGKLAGYTWNLVDEYTDEFRLQVSEVHPDKVFTKTYLCRDHFRPEELSRSGPFRGTLLEEPSFAVRAVLLDHRTPCLGLSLTENFYVNVIKEGLKDLGLPVGPWLNRFKEAIYRREDLGSEFVVTWEEKGEVARRKKFILGDLADRIVKVSPGQKITYITDVMASPENRKKIIELAAGSDLLFIEAVFLHREKEVARRKYHLTASEAGELARQAGVRQLQVFHFSPRYRNQADELEREAREAFNS